MRLAALLDVPDLRLRLLTATDGLEREVRRTITTDLLDPGRFLSGGELVLTGLMWWQGPADIERFLATLARSGVAGLVVGSAGLDSLPADLLPACARHGVPLFEIPADLSFSVITEYVVLALAAERRLPFPAATADLATVLAAVSAELAAGCWVLAPTGRMIAGTGRAPALARRQVLARRYLSADQLPTAVHGPGIATHTLLPAQVGDHRLAGWFVAVEGDGERWSADQRLLTDRLVELVRAEWTAWRAAPDPSGASDDTVFILAATMLNGWPDGAVDVLAELGAHLGAMPPSVTVNDGIAYVSVPTGGRTLAQAGGEITEAVRVLEPGLGAARLAVGVSSPVGWPAVRSGTTEAADACRLAAHRPGPAAVAVGTDLTSHQLLRTAMPEELRTMFRTRLLGPVYTYDKEHRSSLVETLRVFLECAGSWNQAAERLHVHVNTLRYRLRRVEELTGRDLMSFPDRVDFYLALTL
ncbi:PucR family transcriptional regulator [Fodinicola feengrottensis]|uniref:PucR family transcriptional regulator n=1 Tax=Fodinicola feengrottensis TaxID=435914 RepID=A0ABN2IQG1_9ACTN